jgi:hypothetical protein
MSIAKFDMQRFNLKKLNDVEVKQQYKAEISNRFAPLENLDDEDVDINRAWESIREKIKTLATQSLGYYELKQHKLWFDDKCSKLLVQRKQAKLQWFQNPSQRSRDNLNINLKLAGLSMKKGECLNEKLMGLKHTVRIKIPDLYRGKHEFKKLPT